MKVTKATLLKTISGILSDTFTEHYYSTMIFCTKCDAFKWARRPHQASRPRPPKRGRPGPTYPPFDPFGTTSYIPLPGTSRPEFALPLQRPGSHKGPSRGRLTKVILSNHLEKGKNLPVVMFGRLM